MADAMSGDQQGPSIHQEEENEPAGISFAEFFQQTPPDLTVKIKNLARTADREHVAVPDVLLFCEACDGDRMFRAKDSIFVSTEWYQKFLEFICRNCGQRMYRFSILLRVEVVPIGWAIKFAQDGYLLDSGDHNL